MNTRQSLSQVSMRWCVLTALCISLMVVGCSSPPEEESAKKTTETEQQKAEKQQESEQQSQQQQQPQQQQQGQAGSAEGTNSPEQAGGSSSSDQKSGKIATNSGAPPGGGSSKKEEHAGFEKPGSASEAVAMAEAALSRSENSSDLGESYQQAARALQAAEAFSEDPACIRLADAALGRLQALEKKSISPEELKSKGNVSGKTIIIKP